MSLPLSPPEILPGDAPLLLVCDHASNRVPPGYEVLPSDERQGER